MKGLHCSILEPKDIGNCSNHGISARCKVVNLLGVKRLDGTFEPMDYVFESTEDIPPVIIMERDLQAKRRIDGSRMYFTAYPCDEEGDVIRGWFMAGGCFIVTSDSRFPFDYPIPLHDRLE